VKLIQGKRAAGKKTLTPVQSRQCLEADERVARSVMQEDYCIRRGTGCAWTASNVRGRRCAHWPPRAVEPAGPETTPSMRLQRVGSKKSVSGRGGAGIRLSCHPSPLIHGCRLDHIPLSR